MPDPLTPADVEAILRGGGSAADKLQRAATMALEKRAMRDLLTEEEADSLACRYRFGTETLIAMLQAAARLGAERERERAAREREVLQYEAAKARAMFGAAVGRLTRIQSFVHPDGFVVNGINYGFHPPDALVREVWEALSKAIREIDIDAIRRGEGE